VSGVPWRRKVADGAAARNNRVLKDVGEGGKMRLFFLVAAAMLTAGAGPIGDIVWPEYTLVSKPYDEQLTCPRLKAEIDRVDADLSLLHEAQVKAEEAVRIERDMRSPTGRAMADTSSMRTADGGATYVETRGKIKESRRTAQKRYNHLMELLPSCKES
jgi:hypothetical protein